MATNVIAIDRLNIDQLQRQPLLPIDNKREPQPSAQFRDYFLIVRANTKYGRILRCNYSECFLLPNK